VGLGIADRILSYLALARVFILKTVVAQVRLGLAVLAVDVEVPVLAAPILGAGGMPMTWRVRILSI